MLRVSWYINTIWYFLLSLVYTYVISFVYQKERQLSCFIATKNILHQHLVLRVCY